MKLKKSSEAIIKTFKSNGFVLSEPDVLLDSEYIIERSGEKFRSSMLTFESEDGKTMCLRPDLTVASCINFLQKKEFKVKQSKPVVICVFDRDSMREYISLQTLLRNAGISAEIYPSESKLKKQMEYANKIKSPAVILYGEDEIKSSKPTLRDLSTGKEKSIEIKELINEIKKII
jgi:histidyl-tRNA synthetase